MKNWFQVLLTLGSPRGNGKCEWKKHWLGEDPMKQNKEQGRETGRRKLVQSRFSNPVTLWAKTLGVSIWHGTQRYPTQGEGPRAFMHQSILDKFGQMHHLTNHCITDGSSKVNSKHPGISSLLWICAGRAGTRSQRKPSSKKGRCWWSWSLALLFWSGKNEGHSDSSWLLHLSYVGSIAISSDSRITGSTDLVFSCTGEYLKMTFS